MSEQVQEPDPAREEEAEAELDAILEGDEDLGPVEGLLVDDDPDGED